MPSKRDGLRVIDLFCGGGGFSQGFHMAGFDVVYGADFWKPACDTHALNGLGLTEKMDLLPYDVDEILVLKKRLNKSYGPIDVLIGSPPCTEFSFAKKGGRGDIEKGMLLVRKHLEFVALFRPQYWLMENVPRLEQVLEKECDASSGGGWEISYEKLGIPRRRHKELDLVGDCLRIPKGSIFTASDYGACENRKRYIAGCFPEGRMRDRIVAKDVDVSLGGLLTRLEKGVKNARNGGFVEDPNYPGHKVKKDRIRDHFYDTSLHAMYWEEMRHLKRRHIQYGRMNLPEDLGSPARTIMATSNSSSRESLILGTDEKVVYQGRKRRVYRQPTVREVACIQGFPLDFQLMANSLSDRYKLIGNAVPCQLSYALAKSILEDIEAGDHGDESTLRRAEESRARFDKNGCRSIVRKPRKTIDEAGDIGEVHSVYKARVRKHIRRKLLSSKLENDSSIVIFENSTVEDGRVRGGAEWKSCIQRGMGGTFHRVYLDDVSVDSILNAMSSTLDPDDLRAFIRRLYEDVDKGVPIVKEAWVEFPGYTESARNHLRNVSRERLPLPGCSLFQRAFTTDMPDLTEAVGPIDFFDGLDAILLSAFMSEYSDMKMRTLYVKSVKDNGRYPQRTDPRIVPYIKGVEMPLVNLSSALLSIHVLRRMYEADGASRDSAFAVTVYTADQMVVDWFS